jgi:adenosine kinase
VRIAVTGSIATDHLMNFDGKFRDSLLAEQRDKISVSFLADKLQVRRGGCAANIAFGMASLGLRPILVGAVGHDFDDYRSWLELHGVDCDSIHVSDVHHTARFVCTTDQRQSQIASFYTGAMAEAREIELAPVAERGDGLDLVLIAPNDPEAMIRHTQECRERGYRFAADPSQQLAWSDGNVIRSLIDGATYFLSNEYESALARQKTGWTADEIRSRVDTVVTTLGPNGVRIERRGEPDVQVGPAAVRRVVDPTAAGDGFRAGFLTASTWDVTTERAAQVGCVMAAHVLESTGGQEYELTRAGFLARLTESYGDEAFADVEPHLRCVQEEIPVA